MTGPRPDQAQGSDPQGLAVLPRILSPDEFAQARMLSPDQLSKAKFPVLPPPFVPKEATSQPTQQVEQKSTQRGLARILTQYIAQPIADHPLTAMIAPLLPGAGYLFAGMMGKDILEYSAQKAAELSLPPDVRKQAESDPERISGEQAAVEAAMLAVPAVANKAARTAGVKAPPEPGQPAAPPTPLEAGAAALPKVQAEAQSAIAAHVDALADSWRTIFAPATRSPEAMAAANILRASTGEMAASYEQAAFKLDEFRRAVDPLPEADKLGFIDAIEGGKSQASPEFQKAADTIRQTLDETRDAIRALGTGKLEHFIEDYFPHIWEDPEKAGDAFKAAQIIAGSKRPMEGSKSFLKERTIPTTAEGLALGLKPVSTNPVDLTLLKLREMQRYVMAHSALNEMKDNGLVKFVSAGEKAPDAYTRIDDKIATVFGPREGAVTLPEGAQVGGIDPTTGVPLNPDGTVNLYHHTSAENAAAIQSSGRLKSAGEPDVYVTTHPTADTGYGNTAIPVRVKPSRLTLDDEFPNGRKDFRIAAGKPGGEAKVEIGHGDVGTARPMAPEDVQVPGTRIMGQYYAPATVAKVVNNYLSPGLRGNAFYDAYRGLGNTLNQAQLGLSAFHLMFTSMDASVSRAALGLEYLGTGLKEGDMGALVEGVKNIASTPIAPVTNMRLGARIRSAYLNPENAPADMVALANAVKEAGGRVRQDSFYANSAPDKMIEAWKQGEYGKATALSLPALFETAAKPIMEWIVPVQKLGVFGDMAKKALADLPPEATLAERRTALSSAWDSVDNRMGQLVYDNLFWNKTFKDLAMGSVRSVGWNLGTIRELGGGVGDLAKMGQAAITPGESVALTHKAAYVMALPIVVGMYGAAYQYLRTGEGPRELKDYFFPKTGEQDADGNPERVQIASYMKDFFAYGSHPWDTVKHKTSPLLGSVFQMLENKDYYGDAIRNLDDPAVKQVMQEAEYVGKQFEPFGLRNMNEQASRSNVGAVTRLGNWFGITPAPREEVRGPGQNRMADIVAKRGHDEQSPEQVDAAASRRELLAGLRGNANVDLQQAVTDAVERHGMTPIEIGKLLKRAGTTPAVERFKTLTVTQALDVFKKSDPREQALFAEALLKKVEAMQARGGK